MAIQFNCKCGNNLSAPNMFSGTRAKCPHCGMTTMIPSSTPTAESDVGIEFVEPNPKDEIIDAEIVEFLDPPTHASETEIESKPIWIQRMLAAMLDPRSIQWMLMLGGCLMVIGLVVFLTSIGMFANERVLAAFLITGSFSLMATGCVVYLRTKYRLAGQALTFLSCILVPMNLWFLHSHDLITISGNLWLGGLMCCVLYATIVYFTRDPLFMFAVEGGITLTAVLFLANLELAGDAANVVMLLFGLGAVSIHAERFFPRDAKEFNRKRFGLPLFWSGHAQMGVALIMLAVIQIVGWAFGNAWPFNGELFQNRLTSTTLLPGILWVVAVYVYLYSDFVVRRIGAYLYAAAIAALFAVVTFVGTDIGSAAAIIALAVASLIVNIGHRILGTNNDPIARALPPLAQLLSFPPVLLGMWLHVRAANDFVGTPWHFETTWLFVVAMVVVAVCHRISAHLLHASNLRLAWNYMFMSAGSAIVAAAGILRTSGVEHWPTQACLLMLLPLGYLIASRLWRGKFAEQPLGAMAHVATATILFYTFASAVNNLGTWLLVTETVDNLVIALAFAEAALFYGLAANFRRKGVNIYFSAVAGCGAIWQLMCYAGIDGAYYSLMYAAIGYGMLVLARRLGLDWVDRYHSSGSKYRCLDGRGQPAYHCANAILSVAFTAASLRGLVLIFANTLPVGPTTAMIVTLLICVACIVTVPSSTWRFLYGSFATAMLGTLVLRFARNLSAPQVVEIVFVGIGLVLLISSYVSHFRETREGENDSVSPGLWLGSLMASAPLLVATLHHRYWLSTPSLVDEIALITVAILMLWTGVTCQLKAPTLIGGFATTIYLLALIGSLAIFPEATMGVYLAIGGCLLFGAGVVLSVYRERIIELPTRIANRQGVFRIMNWR